MDTAPPPPIIVTAAAFKPSDIAESPATVSVIDQDRLDRLGEPWVAPLLRAIPSVAVSANGPTGTLTEVRIRGAEANHTLLVIDGIRANDPAAGNIPRFELLGASLASRMEVVRGPQSALWGSEAIGGVVAVDTGLAGTTSPQAAAEAGSFGFRQLRAGIGNASVSAGAALTRTRGIDSFDGHGDRDGLAHLAVHARGSIPLSARWRLEGAGFLLGGQSDYDGLDPLTYQRADTGDATRNRMAAGRIGLRWQGHPSEMEAALDGSFLASASRNILDDELLNRTAARRWTLGARVSRPFQTGGIDHRLMLAAELEGEDFRARDVAFGGATNQRRDRAHQSLTGAWQAKAGALSFDLSLRHDRFNRFADATSLRAAFLARVASGVIVAASYGEGIAQPTFFDLYGFFPGQFTGNPGLKPETSRGGEISLRIVRARWSASVAAYRQRLSDEILDVFDDATFQSSTINASGPSRRHGVEIDAGWRIGRDLRLTASYALASAREPAAATDLVKETRRPRHSGSLGIDGRRGRWSFGGLLAYTGERDDVDFDRWPAERVRLAPYWMASGRLAYRASRHAELFARLANAFDARAVDVIGYRTEGRSAYAGIRFAR